MTTNRYRLYIGISQDRDGHNIPFTTRSEALKDIESEATKQFGGYTTFYGEGGYQDPKTLHTFTEDTYVLEIVTDKAPWTIRNLAIVARELLSQSSVLVERSIVSSELITVDTSTWIPQPRGIDTAPERIAA